MRLFCKSKVGLETQTDHLVLTGRTARKTMLVLWFSRFPAVDACLLIPEEKASGSTWQRWPRVLRSPLSSQTPAMVRRVHRGDMTRTLSLNQITIHNRWPCKYLMRGEPWRKWVRKTRGAPLPPQQRRRPSLPSQEKEVIESVFIQYSCAALMDLGCKRFLVSPVVCVLAEHKQDGFVRHGSSPRNQFSFSGRIERSSSEGILRSN